ncbi:ATP-binding protein [Leekyejoonella antrihumi]|uniref:histidine kinase n=1 Tax=Leekyejoonella antrihumi TaxID=1660198 RepID=A0A563DZQ2_9MICO|nr:sensor histidine kinase [Leekyejoonella antrihumi]TWP35740.1 sensor histidine kinase [Leekyejoonella antrihumi]
MPNRTRRLSSQIFIGQLAILVVTMVVGFVLFARSERSHLDSQFESRAAAIAEATAGVPTIRSCMATNGPGCAATVQDIATGIAHQSGASYVVVIDMHRVRHSHPDPALIGQKVAEPIVTKDGRVHTGIDNGSTGRSANGKAPLYGPNGTMVGEVSAGIQESSVSSALWHELPSYAVWFAIALAVGVLASWEVARRLKRRTFGLELDEIARLLQEREATLHGIREGVIAFDEDGRVSVVNDEAQRLLGLKAGSAGGQLENLLPAGGLRDALTRERTELDGIVLTDDFALVINRMPITLAGHPHGAVVTLRDRTEISGLLRELHGERGLTDSLRAQQHEFVNRMHTVAGLLELGCTDEALSYALEVRGTAAEFDNTLRAHIGAPQIVGLLLGKAAEAGERGVELTISPATLIGSSPENLQTLTTIIGNLIDNSFEALTRVPAPRRVTLELLEAEDVVTIAVTDNGPGLPPGASQLVFRDGYSTKAGPDRREGGLGLALVHRLVTRLGGSIEATEGPGARFTVRLPSHRDRVEGGGPS